MLKVVLIISFVTGFRMEIHPVPDHPVIDRRTCIVVLNRLYTQVTATQVMTGLLQRRRIESIRGRCPKVRNREDAV